MMIVVEGIDKSGKSLLVKRISVWLQEAGLDVLAMHFSKPDRDPYEYFEPAILAAENGQTVVTDRYIIGCPVYDAVLKHGIPPSKYSDWYERLLSRAEAIPTILIWANDEPQVIAGRFDSDGETFITKNHILPIHQQFYEHVMAIKRRGKIPVFSYESSENRLTLL